MYPSNSQTNLNYFNQFTGSSDHISQMEHMVPPPHMMVASPFTSPQLNMPSYGFMPNTPSHYNHPHAYQPYTRPPLHSSGSSHQRGSRNASRSNSFLTVSNLNNDNTLDQLNISRTVILKNLNDDISLNELLNHIDFGPIEYIKMFSKPVGKSFEKIDPSITSMKMCFLSFINSKISINFYLKYQNASNLQNLKVNLNSKHLKISLNDIKHSNNGLKDFIKLKTLNYILEFNATRAINLIFKYDQTFNVSDFLQILKINLSEFGEFEDFKIVEVDSNYKEKVASSEMEKAEELQEADFEYISIQIHFNAIDSAIKCYENYLTVIQQDKEKLLENVEKPFYFLNCKFMKDRCERVDNLQNVTMNDKNYLEEGSSPSPLNDNNEDIVTPLDVDGVNGPQNDRDFFFGLNDLDREVDPQSTSREPQIPPLPSSRSNSGSNSNVTSNNNSHVNLAAMSFPSKAPSRTSLSLPMYSPFVNNLNSSSNVSLSMNQGSFDSSGYLYNPDPYNVGNRTIYLGNLHPNSTVEEIANNVRAGGLVESIKYYPEKRNCFITFIDPNIALKFYLNHQVLHQLIIHGYDITVGWAKTHSGPLSREITLAVTAGASRNVYIGIKLNKDAKEEPPAPKPTLPDENELRKDFSHFGDMEQINFYHNKDCGFLNFLNIYDAIKLVELFELKNVEKIKNITGDAGFYDKYKDFKISFGKDRCGNPPKFSFKKKIGKSRQKVYFDSGHNVPKRDSNGITDEAAMVFGIIKGDNSTDNRGHNSQNERDDTDAAERKRETMSRSPDNNGVKLTESQEDDTKSLAAFDIGAPVTEEEENLADGEQEEFGGPLAEAEDVGEEDEDDDDDISIIIGSDDTSSTTAQNSSGSKKSEKKKFYNNTVNTSGSFVPVNSKRSSSAGKNKYRPASISIPQTPTGFMVHPYSAGGHHPPSSFPSPHMAAHPFGPPQHPHSSPALHQMQQMQQQQQATGVPMPYYMSRSNSNYGYYAHPQYTPMMPHPGSIGGTPMMPPAPPGVGMPYYYDNSPTRGSFSGSQVMAQYLAKSQTDNLFYQPSAVYDIDERRRKKS